MIDWLAAHAATIVILAVLIIAAGFAVRTIYRRKGGCSCGCHGGCAGCSGRHGSWEEAERPGERDL